MNKKTIIRADHSKESPYVMILRDIPQNKSLSWEARGILCYLLSQPDDWQATVADLQQNCGAHTVYRVLKELKTAGYIKQERTKNEQGKFVHGDYIVYEKPHRDFQDVDFQDVEIPHVENHDFKEHKNVEETKEKDSSAPQNIGAGEPVETTEIPSHEKHEPTPPALEVVKPRNEWYDAIFEIWNYTAAMNGAMEKMLKGVSAAKGWKEYNLSPPLESPDELKAWAAWYRRTELGGDATLNMLEARIKIQSSVGAWRQTGKKKPPSPLDGMKLIRWDEPA